MNVVCRQSASLISRSVSHEYDINDNDLFCRAASVADWGGGWCLKRIRVMEIVWCEHYLADKHEKDLHRRSSNAVGQR